MIDYRSIETHMKRAGLQRSARLAELIADGILATWFATKRLAIRAAATINMLVQTPDSYSTALPRRF